MKKVSVIIPTYNREKTIMRAVQSVLNQTYTNLEVLIIDDGSTDGTADIVREIQDDRVQYIVLEKNGGASNARNEGVKRATGEWIAFQDSDDSWRPDKLEKQMSYAGAHPEYAMVYGRIAVYLEHGEIIETPCPPWPEIMEGDMLKTLLARNVIGAPVILVKRESFLAIGGFDITYKALEDWEFVIRFSKAYGIGFLPEILMDSYMLSGGISSHVGAYYESRCKMLAQYKTEMQQLGVFETTMEDILFRAQETGILETVTKIMMAYLTQ